MAAGTAIKAGKAFIEIFADNTKLLASLKRAQSSLRGFASSVISIGAKMQAAGAAIIAPLVGTAFHFAAIGDAIHKMSARTGIATETLSELGFAAEQSGSSLEATEKGIRKMQVSIFDLGNGVVSFSGDVDEASTSISEIQKNFASLGLSIKDLQGLDPGEQFEKIAGKIAEIEDPTTRAAVAMKVFGKSGADLVPLLSEGEAGIRALREEAKRLGLSISGKEAKIAADFSDAWNRVTRSFKAIVFVVGSAVAPVLTKLFGIIKPVIVGIIDFARQNKKAIVAVLAASVAVAAIGSAFVAVGFLAIGAAASIGVLISVAAVLKAAFLLLLSPIGAMVVMLGVFSAGLIRHFGKAGAIIGWLKDKFQTLRKDATEALGGIAAAIATGDIAAAMNILGLTIKMEWLRVVNKLNESWQAWKSFFLQVANEMTDKVAQVFNNFFSNIRAGWVVTVEFFSKAWAKFVSVFQKSIIGITQKIFDLGVKFSFVLSDAEKKVARQEIEDIGAGISQKVEDDATVNLKKIADDADAKIDAIKSLQKDTGEALTDLKDIASDDILENEAAALKASSDALGDAVKEWRDAIADANRKESAASEKSADAAESLKATSDESKGKKDPLDELRKVSVTGAFSPFAARGVFAGEKTSKAEDQTARNTAETVKGIGVMTQIMKRNKFAFS